jgi:hypothetical protein
LNGIERTDDSSLLEPNKTKYMTLKDIPEGKEPTEILVIHIEGCVVCDVWGEDRTITAIQSVTFLRLPVKQMCVSIKLVYQAKLFDIMASGEHCDIVSRCTIFLQINKHTIAQMVTKV